MKYTKMVNKKIVKKTATRYPWCPLHRGTPEEQEAMKKVGETCIVHFYGSNGLGKRPITYEETGINMSEDEQHNLMNAFIEKHKEIWEK